VTLTGALEDGAVSPSDVVDDGTATEYFDGYGVACNNNPDGVERFTIAEAYAYSCNVTFARLAAGLGPDRYRRLAESFGLASAPPFPLPVAASSLSSHDSLSLPELASAGFGQGELQVTPLEMALVASAIAGDGTMKVPYLLADVPGVAYKSIADERGTWRRAASSSTAAAMRQIMTQSVRVGWAHSASVGVGVSLGGKTGTAELAQGAPHAWFIGFAPADRPRLAIAVLIVHGGEGSVSAAPLGGRLLEYGLELESER
jgi:peptidoglycan glycosyltransferase